MTHIAYIQKRFNNSSRDIIAQAGLIINEYANAGYDLTLRQLYYQFVARDIFANLEKNYKRLSSIISDARLAGLISWDSIVDRTRSFVSNSHWDSPEQVLRAARNSFYMDRWRYQDYRVEVWIEKDALIGVISQICKRLDLTHFACRGYVSQSTQWRGARRLLEIEEAGQVPIVIHLGDHDPSGIDMTRDIEDRLRTFGCDTVEVHRIALNMDQIEEHQPPPNPTKLSDTRAPDYVARFGHECWELDALEPSYIEEIIEAKVREYVDEDKWDAVVREENAHLATIDDMIERLR